MCVFFCIIFLFLFFFLLRCGTTKSWLTLFTRVASRCVAFVKEQSRAEQRSSAEQRSERQKPKPKSRNSQTGPETHTDRAHWGTGSTQAGPQNVAAIEYASNTNTNKAIAKKKQQKQQKTEEEAAKKVKWASKRTRDRIVFNPSPAASFECHVQCVAMRWRIPNTLHSLPLTPSPIYYTTLCGGPLFNGAAAAAASKNRKQ